MERRGFVGMRLPERGDRGEDPVLGADHFEPDFRDGLALLGIRSPERI